MKPKLISVALLATTMVAIFAPTLALAWSIETHTAGQLRVAQTHQGIVTIQNKGDEITITDAIANRGNCRVYLHPFRPERLRFGDTTDVIFVADEIGSSCELLELKLLTNIGTFAFTWN